MVHLYQGGFAISMDKLNNSNGSDNSLHKQPIERRNFLKWMAAIASSTGVLASTIFAPSTQANAAGWSPKKAALMTRWASQVSPTNAWPLYPRPQMTRPNWLNLNGVWQFEWSTGSDAPPFGKTLAQSILVPYPVNQRYRVLWPISHTCGIELLLPSLQHGKVSRSSCALVPWTGKALSMSTVNKSDAIAAGMMALAGTSHHISTVA